VKATQFIAKVYPYNRFTYRQLILLKVIFCGSYKPRYYFVQKGSS